MTVSTLTNRVVYRGNGSVTSFAVPFNVLDVDHLVVTRQVFATGALDYTYVGTDFSYTGIGNDSGTLTLNGTALSSTYELVIERIVPYTQELDLVNSGGFYPETVETQLDLIVMGLQQAAGAAELALEVAEDSVDDAEAAAQAAIDAAVFTVTSASGQTVTTRTLLAGIAAPANGQTAYLAEAGREGWFKFSTANLSTQVTADSAQGIYVAPTAASTGASGAWVRSDNEPIEVEWFGAVGNGTTLNDAAFLSAIALADGPIAFGVGSYLVSPAVIELTDGQGLIGQGKDVSIILIDPLPAENPDQGSPVLAISTEPGAEGVLLRDFTLDVNKSGIGRGANNRCHGLVIRTSTMSHVENVKVKDCTGYAFWNNGGSAVSGYDAPANLINTESENANVHYEQIYSKNVLIDGAIGSDGDADISREAFFHQYGTGCDGITLRHGRYSGAAIGWSCSASFGDLGRIAIEDCYIENTGNTYAVDIGGTGTIEEIRIEGSTIISVAYTGLSIVKTNKVFLLGSSVTGFSTGFGVGADVDVFAAASYVKATGSPSNAAFALVSDGTVRWSGGGLEAVDGGGGAAATGGGGVIRLSSNTYTSPAVSVAVTTPFTYQEPSGTTSTSSTGFATTWGIQLKSSTDTVGNVVRVVMQGFDSGQVYFEQITEASAFASFALRVRNAGGMSRAFYADGPNSRVTLDFKVKLGLGPFADDAAAGAAGLTTGDIFRETGGAVKWKA